MAVDVRCSARSAGESSPADALVMYLLAAAAGAVVALGVVAIALVVARTRAIHFYLDDERDIDE